MLWKKQKLNKKWFKCRLFIFFLIFCWVFSGWPQIWQNPSFPPKVQETLAVAPLPTYRASGTFTAGTGAITPPYPATMQAGDVCLLVVSSENQAISLTTANGFTEVPTWSPQSAGTAATDPGSRLAVYWKLTVGSDSAPVVADSGNNTEGVIHCFYGVSNTGNPWDTGAGGNDSAANDTTGNIPGSSTTVDNTLVVLITSSSYNGTSAAQCSNWTNANLANITERQDNTNTSGLGGGSCMATGEKASAGSYTTTTVTMAQTTYKGALSLALRPPVAPSVTTQAGSSVEATTATGNGNITATGGQNATAWGVCYKTSSGCTTSDSTAAGSGSGGTGAYTASMTSLSSGTTYYIKAYATNSAGTSYGSEVTILTKPAAPTSVLATDGTYTDKVTITWTKSTGATDYHVWRDSTDLGSAGDVATFDDTGAAVPSITAGSTVASDGTDINDVDLSLSGTSANNGTTHTYKVVASNATGNSADSSTDTGYRGVGSLTYQWQRSAADSDADYSNIDGATSSTYADTGAPSDGSGRYYKCILNATGASQQTSATDRGYRLVAVVSVTLDRSSFNYGFVPANTASSTLSLWGGAGITATNNGTVTENFTIYGANTANWTLAGSAGSDAYIHKFCNDTDNDCTTPPTNYTALTTSPQTLKNGVAASGVCVFQLQLTTPNPSSVYTQQNASVTIQASQP
jgi:hypothetical protein